MFDLEQSRDALRRYEEALAAGDRAQILALVEELLDAGVAPLDIMTGIVAAAQRTIGERWQRGEWSVAQEHAATAMAMAASEVVNARLAKTPVTRGHVIVACAEREWHWLPAAIIGCALRGAGFETTLLGPATSPRRLSRYVQDIGPVAVAVSCSVLGALPTTRRFIETSTSAGVPVLVGGAAFGSDPARAKALGATAWAADAQGAVDAVSGLPVVVSPVPPLPQAPAQELAALELSHPHLVERVRRGWSVTANSEPGTDQATLRAAARDALPQALYAVWAALLTGDTRPLSETATWMGEVLASRGVDAPSAIDELAGVLAAVLVDYPLSMELVRDHFRLG